MSGSDKPIYRGRVISLALETVRLPNGSCIELEIVRHPGGAAVAALDDEGRVCLLRQFRHAADGWVWELPAGKLDPGEDGLGAARRELREEAGVDADTWVSLGTMVSSPGVLTEVIHLYLARGLRLGVHRHEDQEVIEIHWVPWARALRWALSGEIRDAKTLVGLFRAQAILEE